MTLTKSSRRERLPNMSHSDTIYKLSYKCGIFFFCEIKYPYLMSINKIFTGDTSLIFVVHVHYILLLYILIIIIIEKNKISGEKLPEKLVTEKIYIKCGINMQRDTELLTDCCVPLSEHIQ